MGRELQRRYIGTNVRFDMPIAQSLLPLSAPSRRLGLPSERQLPTGKPKDPVAVIGQGKHSLRSGV
jgi:hypothetical protein